MYASDMQSCSYRNSYKICLIQCIYGLVVSKFHTLIFNIFMLRYCDVIVDDVMESNCYCPNAIICIPMVFAIWFTTTRTIIEISILSRCLKKENIFVMALWIEEDWKSVFLPATQRHLPLSSI